MEGYKPGQMSSLLFGQASPGSEKKKKKKAKKAEDGADLLALFNVKPAPVEIPIPAEPKVQDDDKKTDTQKVQGFYKAAYELDGSIVNWGNYKFIL